MNRVTLTTIAITTIFLGQADVASATTQHDSKVISTLELGGAGCYYFQLSGVSQADPILPGSPWFAISTSQANAKEMYALLLSARLSGTTLQKVSTNGQIVCGHAQVVTIDL